ncbi:hypothetical protein DRE_00059 [Drechslerella stenobrocha 248]|uniref:Uncharacterized protein n=1 Tax=Drechslerella stenobrocha 248 TaxID=1043628 RepID=W7HZ14_9PEZI|nr:hypothetical protein DRE_00059 [Drechslerella stenobrocha 248]
MVMDPTSVYQSEEDPWLPASDCACDGVEIYFDGHTRCREEGTISLDPDASLPPATSRRPRRAYLLTAVYAAALISTTFLHRSVLRDLRMPYFLVAVYSSVTTFVCFICILITSFTVATVDAPAANGYTYPRSKQECMTPIADEETQALWPDDGEGREGAEGAGRRLRVQQHAVYLAYPAAAALLTWQWVLGGGLVGEWRARVVAGCLVGVIAAVYGSYEPTVEWWSCVIAVVVRAFKVGEDM